MSKVTFRNIKAGELVLAGYNNNLDEAEFLGFTDNKSKYSETPVFSTAREMLMEVGVTSWSALEAHQDKVAPEYGFHFYAVFKDLRTEDIYRAYLSQGRWVFGTSADSAQLRRI